MDTRNRSTSTSAGSPTNWVLPHKATLSPAQVFGHNAVPVPHTSTESVPRDYSENSTRTGSSGAVSSSSTAMTTNDELLSLSHRRLSRVSEMLHKTAESPPRSPRSLSNFTIAGSPYSSTDSLASLVERQQKNKISNPSHETALFHCNSSARARRTTDTARRSSAASLLAVLQGNTKKRVSDSIPSIKSPLHSSIDATIDSTVTTGTTDSSSTLQSTDSRRLHPPPNPHHVHSSPSVKESKTVSLGYDPVSRKKMLNSYEIIKEIGRGEHGKVKLARHLETDELVAIKIVDRKGPRKSFRPGSSHEEKIRREIAIMKKINHPNVVQLREVMDDANSRKIYLVLEYLEKGEVKWQKAKDVPMMTLKESMMVFRDVVLGLEYLHYQGIVHRDIKPANLLIARDGSVKISDFGVSFASSLKSGEQDDYDLAKTAGTPAFLAPELCRPLDDEDEDHPKITYKIDIWALGVTLYCFLFGKLPFWATNEFELFDVIYTKELVLPEQFSSEFTDDDQKHALDLLTKILDKNPKKRLTIKEIKNHPLTLRDLSPEDARAFVAEQKSCVCKIDVSNEEVQVAVTGLGSKLRKGFAKALKFAFTGKKQSHTEPTTPSTVESVDDPILCDTVSCHRRVKSGDVSCETHANVEGDLFLNKSSALNSLNNIFNDDKRRSSVSLSMQDSGGRSSTAVSESMSNDSSVSRGTQLVSLPVNASFASLDSVYLDNYAPSYAYTSVADARGPVSTPTITTSPPPPQPNTAQGREVFSKMSQFEMNKRTEKKNDEAVAPHHLQPTFDLNDGSDDDEDQEREDDFDFDGEEEEHTDRLSEVSVPSYLVQDLGGHAPSDVDENSRRGSRFSNGPTRGGKPKYSFFETSDSDSDNQHSGPEVIFAESSEDEVEEETLFDHHHLSLQRHRSAEPFGMVLPKHDEEDEEEEESDSSDGELRLSFGGQRSNGHERSSSLNGDPQLDSYGRRHALQRVSSPLSHNAPKTPIATSNAHSHPHPLSHEQYTNHYHKVHGYHGHDGSNGNGRVGRSNSITVGLLKSPSIEGGLN